MEYNSIEKAEDQQVGTQIDPTDPSSLNFQPLTLSPQGKMAHPQRPSSGSVSTGAPSFLSISYYQKYFNVGAIDVKRRLEKGMRIVNRDFLETEGVAPEIWGPIWISLSLAILLFFSSTLALEWGGSIKWGSLDYSLLSLGVMTFLAFAIFEPLGMFYAIGKMFPLNDPYLNNFDLIPLVMLTCYSWMPIFPALVAHYI
jgi:hypothetical protein